MHAKYKKDELNTPLYYLRSIPKQIQSFLCISTLIRCLRGVSNIYYVKCLRKDMIPKQESFSYTLTQQTFGTKCACKTLCQGRNNVLYSYFSITVTISVTMSKTWYSFEGEPYMELHVTHGITISRSSNVIAKI